MYRYRRGRRPVRRYRKGTSFSRFNLYRKRSSAAQSRQIYGLNKKLMRIQRLTKPEIMVAPLVEGVYPRPGGGAVNTVNGVDIYRAVNLTNIGLPGGEDQGYQVGRFCRLQNITLKGVFTYTQPIAPDGAVDDGADLQRMVSYLRILIIQTKATRAQELTYDDVFTIKPYDDSAAYLSPYSMIRAPLKNGLARSAKVLSDKTYMLSDTRQAVNIKTKLNYIKNWYRGSNEAVPKGAVYMYSMIYTQDSATTSVSATSFNFVSKCVYTDA